MERDNLLFFFPNTLSYAQKSMSTSMGSMILRLTMSIFKSKRGKYANADVCSCHLTVQQTIMDSKEISGPSRAKGTTIIEHEINRLWY